MKSPLIVVIALICVFATAIPEPVYTIHYVRNYRRDQASDNFGCGKAVVFGTYLHPTGAVDALYTLINANVYNLSLNCPRKSSYMKLFGDAQDYSKLMQTYTQNLNGISTTASRARVDIIIDWKYLPEGEEREKAFRVLGDIIQNFASKGQKTLLKAPASYFCAQVGTTGKRFILDQAIDYFIMELHGEEPGRYTTY
jgi:hypothetical protein